MSSFWPDVAKYAKIKIILEKCANHRYSKMQDIGQTQDRNDVFIETVETLEKCVKIIETAEAEGDEQKWTEDLTINKKKLLFKLDTGAECKVMSAKNLSSTKYQREAPLIQLQTSCIFRP